MSEIVQNCFAANDFTFGILTWNEIAKEYIDAMLLFGVAERVAVVSA